MLEHIENNDVPCVKKIETIDDLKTFYEENFDNKDGLSPPDELGIISNPNSLSGIYFRGHSEESYRLESTFERHVNELLKNISDEKYLEIERKYFEQCKYFLRGYFPEQQMLLVKNDEEYEKEIWAYCQHYDIETPLLDWTKSFWIAVYFAFEKRKSESDYRVVYILTDSWTEDDRKEFPQLVFEPKTDFGRRLTAQQGVFTKKRCSELLELNARHISKHKDVPFNPKPMLIKKVLISSKIRTSIMEYLMKINIYGSTVYPDIKGVVKNAHLELDNILNTENLPME